MKEESIKIWLKIGILRKKQSDKEKIKSMIESAEINVKIAKTINLTNESATLIFREIYESIRQLGETKWWLEGYEPQAAPGSHEVSLEILKEMDIKEKVKLNYLERFKNIRHDMNYHGFRASIAQAKEIIEFWDVCSGDIIDIIKNKL